MITMHVLETKTWVRLAVVAVAAAALIVFAMGTTAKADDGFSIETIEGNWTTLAWGTIVPGEIVPESTPVSGVGVITINEDATCSLNFLSNVGGTTFATPPGDCTVVVSPDGTVVLTADFVLRLAIVDEDEMFGMVEGENVVSLQMKRQEADDDDNDDG